MKPVNDIVNELEAMGSPLANFSRKMPYNLPDGYFDKLTINTQLDEPIAMFATAKASPFDVPEGYFQNLAGNILQKIKDQDDNNEIELTINNLSKNMPFAIPSSYFEHSLEAILTKIEQPSFGKIASPSFAIPEHYFEQFPQIIASKIKASTQQKQIAKPATKIISLSSKVWRYAAAAVVCLGIGLGIYQMTGTTNTSPDAVAAKKLSKIDPKVIDGYIQSNIDDYDLELLAENNRLINNNAEKNIKSLNTQEINEYLDEVEL